jgi:hypothetical protein
MIGFFKDGRLSLASSNAVFYSLSGYWKLFKEGDLNMARMINYNGDVYAGEIIIDENSGIRFDENIERKIEYKSGQTYVGRVNNNNEREGNGTLTYNDTNQ